MPAERFGLWGRVQGVGMRPSLYRLACEHGLTGRIRNDGGGVDLELHGPAPALEAFAQALPAALPPLARLDRLRRQRLEPAPTPPRTLAIEACAETGQGAVALPDAATCEACLAETLDPAARRYRYPFTNCTHCGPRLSIQRSIPWDRGRTSMAGFALCPECAAEYADVADRRYHAQPIACPGCGPQCTLVDAAGQGLAHGPGVIEAAAAGLARGQILAIKGLGGFHLACAATDAAAIARLRERKRRPRKALAVMGRDLDSLAGWVEIDAGAQEMLSAVSAPIVLLPRRADCALPDLLAPGLDSLGVMLPATPLQHLLLRSVGGPLVMTSGNTAGAPPCIDNDEALRRLAGVADAFLLHDRPIANRLDDSVLQRAGEAVQVLRLARGLAPLQQPHGGEVAAPVLALGGQLKASFALLREDDWIVSQHIGDLAQADNLRDYERALQRYLALYDVRPAAIAVDAHPGYRTHQYGRQLAAAGELPLIEVQHHHAHAVSVLAEAGRGPRQGPWLAVCFDGLGYGAGGELWGGELLQLTFSGYRRLGRWRPAQLIGGTAAMHEPWRNLYAVLDQLGGWHAIAESHPRLAARLSWPQPPQALDRMLARALNCPPCSSVGRGFDALACLLGLAPQRLEYEAEAALRLQAVTGPVGGTRYRIALETRDGLLEWDWRGLWRALLADAERGRDAGVIASDFHTALTEAVVAACVRLVEEQGLAREVVLCGGVFQNPRLLAQCRQGLAARGLQALSAQQLPANDAGLALGQAWAAAAQRQSAYSKAISEVRACV